MTEVIARVHSAHLVNVVRRHVAADPQTKHLTWAMSLPVSGSYRLRPPFPLSTASLVLLPDFDTCPLGALCTRLHGICFNCWLIFSPMHYHGRTNANGSDPFPFMSCIGCGKVKPSVFFHLVSIRRAICKNLNQNPLLGTCLSGWLSHSAHRIGMAYRRGRVQSPGWPVDFVFEIQGCMLWD